MLQFSEFARSSVGKKFIMAITGLAMIVFLIEHLSGNLLLLSRNPDPFNKYAHFLISLGELLIIVELVFVAFLLFHVISAISIALGKKKARPVNYQKTGNAGGASRKNLASSTMIFTGLLLLVFLVIHLKTFKYGPHYTTTVNGVVMRDLHRLVMEVFSQPLYVLWYVAALIFLGFHLKHGFWSAFQSLGFSHPRFSPLVYTSGIVVAIVLVIGFIGIPVWIYFTGA